MAINNVDDIHLARLDPFVVARRVIEGISDVFPFKVSGVALSVIIGGEGHTQRVAIIFHGRSELDIDFIIGHAVRNLSVANQPVFVLVGSAVGITVHGSVCYFIINTLVPALVAIGIKSREHAKVFVEVFIEQHIDLFRGGIHRRIVAVGLVVNVSTAVGVGEDGEMIGGVRLQTAEHNAIHAVSHILGHVAIRNGSAIGGNSDAARGSQHQILVRQLCACGVLPGEADIHTVNIGVERCGIVARLGIGLGTAASFVETDTRINVRRFGITAEKRGIVGGVGVETHVVARVFTLSHDFSRAITVEGDAPLAVGIKS